MSNRNRLTQVLPDSRIIPRIMFLSRRELENGQVATDKNVHPDIADKLSELALRAYASARNKTVAFYEDKDEPIAVILAPTCALNAANHFVSEKEFETPLPNFRNVVANKGKSSLKEAITKLLDKMPPDGSPPFPQMRKLAGQREWQVKLNPTIVREALRRWLELMDQLSAMVGRGRSPITAEVKFVGALAHYWTEELGATLGNSRSWANRPKEFEQKGLFASFVRKAGEIIPKNYRPTSWDHAIRSIAEKTKKKR